MSTQQSKNILINFEEAVSSANSIEDIQREQLIMRMITIATMRVTRGEMPSVPFDMKFFADCVSELCDEKVNLQKILSGEDLRW
jgi:hypothetical protein